MLTSSRLAHALWVCVLGVCLVNPLQAQTETAFDAEATGDELDRLVAALNASPDSTELLANVRSRAAELAADAADCNAEWTAERSRLEDRYAPFEEVDDDVAPSVLRQREATRDRLDAAIARQTACARLEDEALGLIERVTVMQNRLSERFLSYRGDSILTTLRTFPERALGWPEQIRRANDLSLVNELSALDLFWMLIGGGVLGAGLGIVVRHRFRRWYDQTSDAKSPPRLRYLFPKPLAEYAPSLLSGFALVAILFVTVENPSLELAVIRIALGILLYGIACVIIDWATGPLSPAASIKGLIPRHVRPLRRRLRLVALTLIASFIVLGTNWLTIRLIGPDVPGRALMIFLVASSLLLLIAYLGRIPGLKYRFRLLRALTTIAVLVSIVAVLIGYQNFAGYIIHGITRSALALFVLWVLIWLVSNVLRQLQDGETDDASLLRQTFGAGGDLSRSGIGVMQLVADLILWISVVVYLIYVWDESGTTLDSLIDLVVRGGTVGDINLVPAQIIGGILVFAALLIVIGWIKRWIDRRWLQHIVTERGAREALITLFGYVAFVIALLVGLTQAGVDLGGLAIVSGALALGIGFGLQEIANNFVSGLILLFERPIRSGDFVTVGDIDGFVRKISIRATEIETLDNQDVLVPNSELVSGRVTNWVLRDPHGRIRLEVGVAYGSDVETVRDLLQKVANDHPEVITDGRAPAPRALFMGFGDSSLDFELRCRINRIDRRFAVISDLNFAIDAAFRAADVVIPFPQRDLNIVSYPRPDVAEAPREIEPAKQTPPPSAKAPAETITRQHTEEIELAADIGEVWNALTDAERLQSWIGEEVEMAPYIGGSYRWELGEGNTLLGRIDMFIPPQRMRLTQAPAEGEEPLPTGPITTLFTLYETDGKTVLTVSVAGIPATEEWEEDYNRSESFWKGALVELRDHVSRK